ncbi:hypothetical protein LguiA_034632 [Lonicera macranthoides]
MNKYKEEGPKLCAKGCGFFGTPANHDLCSKCYNDYLKQKLTNSAASIVDSEEKLTPNSSSKGTTNTANGTTLITANSNNDESSSSTNADDDIVKVIKRNRCESCKKRVGLLGFGCSRCGGLYCGTHRYPEEHSCPFDFKESGRADLAHKNPLCKGDKLGTRA